MSPLKASVVYFVSRIPTNEPTRESRQRRETVAWLKNDKICHRWNGRWREGESEWSEDWERTAFPYLHLENGAKGHQTMAAYTELERTNVGRTRSKRSNCTMGEADHGDSIPMFLSLCFPRCVRCFSYPLAHLIFPFLLFIMSPRDVAKWVILEMWGEQKEQKCNIGSKNGESFGTDIGKETRNVIER